MLTRTCPPGLALAGPYMTEVRILVQFHTFRATGPGPVRVGAQSGLGPGPGWGPYVPLWAHIWAHMGPHGSIWAHMGPYGSSWTGLEIP